MAINVWLEMPTFAQLLDMFPWPLVGDGDFCRRNFIYNSPSDTQAGNRRGFYRPSLVEVTAVITLNTWPYRHRARCRGKHQKHGPFNGLFKLSFRLDGSLVSGCCGRHLEVGGH